MISMIPVYGRMAENCYLDIDENSGHGWIIDPGAEADAILEVIRENGWVIEKILLTHGHFDHIGAVNELRDALKVPVVIHETEENYLTRPENNLSRRYAPEIVIEGAENVNDGEEVALDANPEKKVKVICTPGHTTDSVLYYNEKEGYAFSGDTIFRGSVGITCHPGGDDDALRESILSACSSCRRRRDCIPGTAM